MAVADYSTTPASNVTISGINIAEGCPAGNMNGATRQQLADTKVFYNEVVGAELTIAARFAALMAKVGGTFTGDIFRNGRGAYLHHNQPSYLSGAVFTTAIGAADPTTEVGHVWVELSA